MTVLLEPDEMSPLPAGPTPRATRAAYAAAALVALVLLGLVAWMLAPLPEVVRGSLSQDGGLVADGDSVGETRLLVPVGGTEALQSVRNEGRLAVTLTAPGTPDPLSEVVGFLAVDARGSLAPRTALRRSVVVEPGREAAVVLRVTKGCAAYDAGSSGTVEEFAVRTTALGRSADQRVAYRLPVTVTGPHTPGPECR